MAPWIVLTFLVVHLVSLLPFQFCLTKWLRCRMVARSLVASCS